jgi:hypothetical protein
MWSTGVPQATGRHLPDASMHALLRIMTNLLQHVAVHHQLSVGL